MRLPILLAAILVTILFVLNPEMDEFQLFAERQAAQLVSGQADGSTLGRVLGEFSSGIAGRVVRRLAERDNYLLFSVYTLDFDGPEREGNEWKFLGIASYFVELHRPESLADVQRELQQP